MILYNKSIATVGCDVSTIDKMLRGVRSSNTALGYQVLTVMTALIAARKKRSRK